MSRHTIAVVDHDDAAVVAVSGASDEDRRGVGVASVAQHLDDDILGAADVLRCLAPFRFRRPQTNEATSEVCFDSEVAFAADVFNKRGKRAVAHIIRLSCYFAMPIARLSRMTTTFT